MYAREEAGPRSDKIKKTTDMEATTTTTKKRARRKKLTPEENRPKKWSIVPRNKYMEAFLKNQGSFVVYDPNFML